jgi:hypothetical protein
MEDPSRSTMAHAEERRGSPPAAAPATSAKTGVDRSPAGADVKVIDLTQGEQPHQLSAAEELDMAQLNQLLPASAKAPFSLGAADYTFLDKQPTVTLNSGHSMPMVGLGTW